MNLQNSMVLAPHEALEVRELLSSEALCIKKLQANISMVQDNELKQFINETISAKQNAINNMQQLISQVTMG